MAYKVVDGLNLARKMGKGVPFTGIDVSICDIVSAEIYRYYPWRDTLKTSPDNWTEVTLTDGNQDFATGLTDIFRMTQFWLRRLVPGAPDQVINLNVKKSIVIDLLPKSPASIRAASYQAGVNKFRLEAAIRVPANTTFQLGGEYQPFHVAISDLQDPLWLQDQYLDVFAKGLIYWAYRIADDSRSGLAQKRDEAPTVYTGALGEWKNAIESMAAAEDFGNIDTYYPDDSLGAVDGRRWYASEVFPALII